MPDHATKRCSKCGETKPLSGFSRDRAAPDGLNRWCKPCHTEYCRQYYQANRAALREQQRQYRAADVETHRERVRQWRVRVREQVFAHYGTACSCCGATKNLTIDHIDGHGARHRRELFGKQDGAGGARFYAWIIRHGFPPGLATLCRACNLSKGTGERCYLHRVELPSGESLIFNLYKVVAVKLGDERYVFDRASLMYPEVVELEQVTGYSYGEWQSELGRYSIRAVAGLLHILRRRAGVPSDFASMNFAAADLDVVPLHDDDREFTAAEVAEDVTRRAAEAREAANPTSATAAPAPVASGQTPGTNGTSRSSPASITSGRGNGNGSRGATSRSSKRTPTPA